MEPVRVSDESKMGLQKEVGGIKTEPEKELDNLEMEPEEETGEIKMEPEKRSDEPKGQLGSGRFAGRRVFMYQLCNMNDIESCYRSNESNALSDLINKFIRFTVFPIDKLQMAPEIQEIRDHMMIARFRVILRVCHELTSICEAVEMRATLTSLLLSHTLWPPSVLCDCSLNEIRNSLSSMIKTFKEKGFLGGLSKRSILADYIYSDHELHYIRKTMIALKEFVDRLLATPFCITCVVARERYFKSIKLGDFPCCGNHGDSWYFRKPLSKSDTDGLYLWQDDLLEFDETSRLYDRSLDYNCTCPLFLTCGISNIETGKEKEQLDESEYQLRRSNLVAKLWEKCRRFKLAIELDLNIIPS